MVIKYSLQPEVEQVQQVEAEQVECQQRQVDVLAAVHLVDQEREELRADKWGTFAVFETKIGDRWREKYGCKVIFQPLKYKNDVKESQ